MSDDYGTTAHGRKAVVGARSLVTERSYFPIELEHRKDCWKVGSVRHAT
jgi:hypothetical protein